MAFLLWLEESALSVWVRETPSVWAFPFVLFLHTLGLGFLVGINVAFNLWIVGFAERHPITPLETLFPVMWAGFWINAFSGVLLLIAYPAKALTDPVFYLKMMLILAALTQVQWLRRAVFAQAAAGGTLRVTAGVRSVAVVTLLCWGGAILTGRLLAYTYNVMMATELAF